jgi:hypothetical protein
VAIRDAGNPAAEEILASIGWAERPDSAVIFETSGRVDPLVPIEPSTILWERLPVGDHGWARLVTTLGPAELPPESARPI